MQSVISGQYCKRHGIEKTVWHPLPKSALGGHWECRACRAESYQRKRGRQRSAAYAALGGKCARCGTTDCRLFNVDHVNGDGAEEKRKFGGAGVTALLGLVDFRQWFYSHLDRYQILCANCHVLKGLEHDDSNKAHRKYTQPTVCTSWEVTDAS